MRFSKVIRAWTGNKNFLYLALQKSLDYIKNAFVSSPQRSTPETLDIPESVKQMLCPNALTDHLMFDNDTLIKKQH